MRLDLAERLRCPATHHTPTPLVVVARAVEGRDLRTGLAGCPLCRLEARFVDGDLCFDVPALGPGAAATDVPPVREAAAPSDAVERLVALLGLAEPGGAVLLTPGYASLAEALVAATGVEAVLFDPAGTGALPPGRWVRGLATAVPFTDATFRAAALDAASSAIAAEVLRCVVPQGRLVGAAGLTPPDGVTVLARDDREWVGERGALSGPMVPLGRRGH